MRRTLWAWMSVVSVAGLLGPFSTLSNGQGYYSRPADVRREVQKELQRQKDLRSWGSQDYYSGPKGQVVNARDIPRAGAPGYHYLGSKNLGRKPDYLRPIPGITAPW